MKRFISYLHNHFYLDIMVLFFLFLAFFIEPILSVIETGKFIFNPISQIFNGYIKILISPDILITDYVYIAGLGATFFNVASILLINLILVRLLKIKINGPIYAGMIMICGFSFFGKNLFNTIPIYLGIYIFSLIRKIPYKSLIITTLFSTGLSPLVSYTMFGFDFPLYLSIPLGVLCGIIVGLIIPAFATHTIVFHEGYNLFNTGFALGIISAIFYGIFCFFNLEVNTASLYDYSTTKVFYYVLPTLSVVSIIMAFIGDSQVYKKYASLIKSTGRLISDYAYDYNNETVLFNFGIIGLFLFAICLIFNIPMNGVVFGSILSILGFAGYGLHIRNVLPIWVGATIALVCKCLVNNSWELSIASIMCFIFASGLAPVAGRYGIIYGIVAGILHVFLTPIMLDFQGGFDLYNNGISAGFVAAIIVVIAEKIDVRRNRNGRKSKTM